MSDVKASLASSLGRGVVAGLAGTVVMTAFQRGVEMPLSKRTESYAPASFAEKVLRVRPSGAQGRKWLNEATHLALGSMWGASYGLAAHAGLRGQRAVAAVFLGVYTADVALNTALGLYQPATWSSRDWVIDVVDKFVQAEATGLIFDSVLRRAG